MLHTWNQICFHSSKVSRSIIQRHFYTSNAIMEYISNARSEPE